MKVSVNLALHCLPSLLYNLFSDLTEVSTPIRDGIPLYKIDFTDTDDDSVDSSSNQSHGNGLHSDDEESVDTNVHDAVSFKFSFLFHDFIQMTLDSYSLFLTRTTFCFYMLVWYSLL